MKHCLQPWRQDDYPAAEQTHDSNYLDTCWGTGRGSRCWSIEAQPKPQLTPPGSSCLVSELWWRSSSTDRCSCAWSSWRLQYKTIGRKKADDIFAISGSEWILQVCRLPGDLPTHNVISEETQSVDGVVVSLLVFLLIYGERYLHFLGPAEEEKRRPSGDVMMINRCKRTRKQMGKNKKALASHKRAHLFVLLPSCVL